MAAGSPVWSPPRSRSPLAHIFPSTGEHTPAQFRSTMLRLALFVVLAASDLLVQCRAAVGPGRLAAFRKEFSVARDQCTLRHLPLRFRRPTAGCESSPARHAGIFLREGAAGKASRRAIRGHATVVRAGRPSPLRGPLQWPHRGVAAEGRHRHRGSRLRPHRFQWRQGKDLSNSLPKM